MALAITNLLDHVASDLPCALLLTVTVLLILRRVLDGRAKPVVKDD